MYVTIIYFTSILIKLNKKKISNFYLYAEVNIINKFVLIFERKYIQIY